jgi:uncharacterized membrane protein YsdA (DUF1294 family)
MQKSKYFFDYFISSDSHIYYFMVYCFYPGFTQVRWKKLIDSKSCLLWEKASLSPMEVLMKIHDILFCYLIFMNILSFLLMGTDKYKARHKKWRIPEKTLFLTAILGGSIGSILGMQLFRHKTRHLTFVAGMPCILIVQILLAVYLL